MVFLNLFFPAKLQFYKKEKEGGKRLSNFLLSVYFDPFSRLLCKKYKNTLECARSKPKADMTAHGHY